MKKGRHQVVQMQNGMQIVENQEPTKDEYLARYLDDDNNLFWVYAIEDESHLVAPIVPQLLWVEAIIVSRREEVCGRGKRRPRGIGGPRKCSDCGRLGHNV